MVSEFSKKEGSQNMNKKEKTKSKAGRTWTWNCIEWGTQTT